MASEWKLVARGGVEALERFLAEHEPAAVVASEKVRTGYLDKRLRNGGRYYYLPGEAAVYHGPGGFLAPVGVQTLGGMDAGGRAERLRTDLRKAIGSGVNLHSILGTTPDVEQLQRAIRRPFTHRLDYDLLALDYTRFPAVEPPPHRELHVRRPTANQWRALMSLQTSYEIEEVLLPGRSPSPSVSRASIVQSLTSQLVLVAQHEDRVVARVATNARGFRSDQIGGVYTEPAWRGQGVARWLMTLLLKEIREQRRSASLFVKLDNTPAQALYRGLGFQFESDFTISYYR